MLPSGVAEALLAAYPRIKTEAEGMLDSGMIDGAGDAYPVRQTSHAPFSLSLSLCLSLSLSLSLSLCVCLSLSLSLYTRMLLPDDTVLRKLAGRDSSILIHHSR
eukprot:COSAG03_NODE_11514_length_588_cov_2.306748_2_plen_104_part_00